MTRILLHSNGPNVSTGYGVQAALLVPQLKDAGHDIAVSCTYGQQGSAGSWRGVTLYPNGYEIHGNDVVHNHAKHHFQGDLLGGWIITLLDVWALQNPLLRDFQVAAWCPVDHFPVPPGVLAFFERTGAVPIAMSRFGERLLFDAGLEPVYVPLAVDTSVYKPTRVVQFSDGQMDAREMLQIPAEAFVVGMVAMNKGWARDRKGFNEALRAFAEFQRRHPEAILYLHTEQHGAAEGIDLLELIVHAGIPNSAVRWVDQYAYRLGIPAEAMAATYTAMDVLLSPSHGEGFCVPLIEAQACGTPVIASDFSSQRELASPEYGAAGWLVQGQPEWDPAQKATYICPFIGSVVEKLEEAYAADLPALAEKAIAFAAQYDARRVFEEFWVPFLATLDPPEPLSGLEPIVGSADIAIVVPVMRRPKNAAPFMASANATMQLPHVYAVCDREDSATAQAWLQAGATVLYSDRGSTYAQKVNDAVGKTSEPWLMVVGDDVEFHPGWWEEAAKLSDRYHVIGTNDSLPGRVRNPEVASGRHADHWLIRRSYIETDGGCLDGPGVATPEAYGHWFTDREVIELARARGVFSPCLTSIVEHHHPGYDGLPRDEVYVKAIATSSDDAKTWANRSTLIDMQRVSRSKR